MKQRVAAVLSCLALLVPAVAGAQGVSAGIKGGALFASIPQFNKDLEGTGIDVGQRLGLIGGGFLTLSLAPGFAIQPEVLFTQKGVKGTSPDGDINLRMDYLDVPVLLRISIGAGPARVYFFGGPSFNVILKSELVDGDTTTDVKDDTEKFEATAVGGLGVEVGKFLIEGRWIEGLRTVSTDATEDYKTRTFAVMAGFRF